jgi:ankyrin repeat protein
VDVNVKNQGGYTALMIADFNDYPEVVKLLKAAGAQE